MAMESPTGSDADIAPRVLYEDNHLIAMNKRCGEISQGDKSGDPPLGDEVASYLKKRDNKPGNVFLTPVHRLDRPVSGVTLFAKTSKATSRMNRLFREGKVKKKYWAIVAKAPPSTEGHLVHYLVRDPKRNKSFAHVESAGNRKKSELDYRILAESDRYLLLEISMWSGRHHQIRAQLAAIGCPIRGDLKYGYPRSNPGGGISLHARSIDLEHPVGKGPLSIVAATPDERLWQVFLDLVDDGRGSTESP